MYNKCKFNTIYAKVKQKNMAKFKLLIIYIVNRLRMSVLSEVLSSLVPLLEQPSESVFTNIYD